LAGFQERLVDRVQTSLAGLDAATRFYILWRYTYGAADLEAGEAIIFANGTHVELDGAQGLSSRAQALAAKNKGKYHLLDYTERGHDTALGMPAEDGHGAERKALWRGRAVEFNSHKTRGNIQRRLREAGGLTQYARPDLRGPEQVRWGSEDTTVGTADSGATLGTRASRGGGESG